MRILPWVVLGWLALSVGCGDDDGAGRVDAGDDDAGAGVCRVDGDCNDGVFCNGVERCLPNDPNADEGGCIGGVAPRCNDGLACTEDVCSHVANDCRFVPIDADGDGHAAITCVTNEGEPLGDDCDDADANRFPGNPESCTTATQDHDEDCDPLTFDHRDLDGDGAIDATCCNGIRCGGDCDDTKRDVGPNYPEICDGIDNNCDDVTDIDAIATSWFLDADGDGFGRDDENPVESCLPQTGRSLFNTDLDDSNAAINPAATEVCDGLDNDCDMATDERDVCTCGVPGAAACECVSGLRDCFGGLIPRSCVDGHWVTQTACRGRTPLCVMGDCVCVGGGTACTAIVDRSPPFVIAAAPGPVRRVPTTAVVSILLSELPDPASVDADSFQLLLHGVQVSASLAIDGELLILTPDDALSPGRVYTVVLNGVSETDPDAGVTDEAGNVLSESYQFQFVTAPRAYPRELIGSAADSRFAGPIYLDSNDAGEAIVSAEYSLESGDIVIPREEVFTRSSDGQWTGRNLDVPEIYVPRVGIGDNGTYYALTAPEAGAATSYFRGPNDLNWTQQSIAGTNVSAFTIGGDESCVVTNSNGLTFHIPSSSGGYTGTAAPATTTPSDVAVAGNASRHYAAIGVGGAAEVFYWVAPSGAPAGHAYSTGGFATSQPFIAMNAAGNAVATWVEPNARPGGVGAPAPTQRVAFVGETTASISAIELNSGGTHAKPRVVWLSDGAVLAVRHDGVQVVAQRIASDGTVGAPTVLGAELNGPRAGDVGVVALSNGGALVAWVNGASLAGASSTVVVARYRGGAFEAAEVIADANVDVSLQAAPLPGGRALVVWSQTGASLPGVAVVLQ